jgi:DNA-binding IclR family transcriptional regulator
MPQPLTNRRRGITDRQLEIAGYLAAEPTIGTTKLANRLQVDPAVVWRIVRTLMQRGVVSYNERRRVWRVKLPCSTDETKSP